MAVSILGRIEPAPNWPAFKYDFGFVGRDLFESLFVRLAVVDASVFDGGENHERRRFEMTGQEAGGAVLVDHGRDAADPAHRIDRHRNASAAATDDDLPGVDQALDRWHLDDLPRQRRRHHAAETAAAFVADLPAVFRAMSFGLSRGEHRADRFVRIPKRGVVGVDQHRRDDGRHIAGEISPVHRVRQALGDHVAHAGLRVGNANFERNRVELAAGQLDAPQDVADLRAVAVRDDQAGSRARWRRRAPRPFR